MRKLIMRAVLLAAILPICGSPVADTMPRPYTVGPEDVLEISVWREEGLQREVLVRPDGGLTFPLVGEVQAVGKTPDELRAVIAERIARYIPDPVVTVAVLKVGSNKVYVMGEVKQPGEYLTGRYVDVLQVLSMAGGFTPYASVSNIKILRREQGRERVIAFDYKDVKGGRRLEQNIILEKGDVILVP